MDIMNDKPKKKPKKIEEMSKEQIRQAVLKKRECNAKAQKIVESLLEKGITENFLLTCLPDINQTHFDDVIEERSITNCCGYPICLKSISKKDIPKQKYRISLKTNKVYDITARKNFCSNECYRSAMHVKNQLLTSPLWCRDYEDMPTFHLLPHGSAGSMGQEVDLSFVEKIEFDAAKQSFTSFNDFASASLKEMDNVNDADNRDDIDKDHYPILDNKQNSENKPSHVKAENDNETDPVISDKSIVSNKEISNNLSNENTTALNNILLEKNNVDNSQAIKLDVEKKKSINLLNIIGEVIERPEKKIDPILRSGPGTPKDIKKKIQPRKQPVVTALTIQVEKCLADWFTLDTIIFVFGKEKAKEMITDKGEAIKEYLENYSKSISYNSNTYDQYQTLCRKLNMLELEDRRFDSEASQKETKPLPDYSILQEESKKMKLKVKAFFAGETEVPELQSVQVDKETASEDDAKLTQLPLVDKNSQNALRRRIVCEHLNKVLPDLLRSLGLLSLSISTEIRLLVNTFKLKPNNIMFKPIQWMLIAIIFIKLLSVRDCRLDHLLEQPKAFQHMQLLLLSYKQDCGYLDRLISWLTDIDRLLDTKDTQFTIE